MLRRLKDIDNVETPGPNTSDGRAALASSAIVELEAQLIDLKRQLASDKSLDRWAKVITHSAFYHPSIPGVARQNLCELRTLRAFGTRRLHDVVGGPVRGGVEVARQDRQVGRPAQHHDGERSCSPTRHHQEICPRLATGNGHHVLAAFLPTGSDVNAATSQGVEVEYTVDRRPVDTDIDDVT